MVFRTKIISVYAAIKSFHSMKHLIKIDDYSRYRIISIFRTLFCNFNFCSKNLSLLRNETKLLSEITQVQRKDYMYKHELFLFL